MEVVFGSSVSCTRVYVFSDSVFMLWKDEREPTMQYCMGRQIDVVQRSRPTLAHPILAHPFLANPFGKPILANPFFAKIRG